MADFTATFKATLKSPTPPHHPDHIYKIYFLFLFSVLWVLIQSRRISAPEGF
jgi:hypothetical protein